MPETPLVPSKLKQPDDRRADPFVIGRIYHPKQFPSRWGWQDQRHVSFFVAWWLDTRTL